MNQKGFTLVELLAMMVVISILMVIAIPNISGIIKKNRESMGVEDVNKFVRAAKTKFSIKEATYPSQNNACVIMTLNYVDTNDDFTAGGVNGGSYSTGESIIVVRRVPKSDSSAYEFYVRFVESSDDPSRPYVLDLVEYNAYSENPQAPSRINLVKLEDYEGNEVNFVKAINHNNSICSAGVEAVYK